MPDLSFLLPKRAKTQAETQADAEAFAKRVNECPKVGPGVYGPEAVTRLMHFGRAEIVNHKRPAPTQNERKASLPEIPLPPANCGMSGQ